MHALLPRTLQHNGFLWFDRPSLYFCAVRTEVESRGFSDSFAMAISGIRQAMMNLSFWIFTASSKGRIYQTRIPRVAVVSKNTSSNFPPKTSKVPTLAAQSVVKIHLLITTRTPLVFIRPSSFQFATHTPTSITWMTVDSNDPSWWPIIDWNILCSYFFGL